MIEFFKGLWYVISGKKARDRRAAWAESEAQWQELLIQREMEYIKSLDAMEVAKNEYYKQVAMLPE